MAGVVAAVFGLPATLIAPAPFAPQVDAQAVMAALVDAGLSPDVKLDLGNKISLYSFASRPDSAHAFLGDAVTLGDYVYAVKGSSGYDAFIANVINYQNTYYSNLRSQSIQVLTSKIPSFSGHPFCERV